MEQEKNINKMGTIPVQRLTLSMGVPMIFSMMLHPLRHGLFFLL